MASFEQIHSVRALTASLLLHYGTLRRRRRDTLSSHLSASAGMLQTWKFASEDALGITSHLSGTYTQITVNFPCGVKV